MAAPIPRLAPVTRSTPSMARSFPETTLQRKSGRPPPMPRRTGKSRFGGAARAIYKLTRTICQTYHSFENSFDQGEELAMIDRRSAMQAVFSIAAALIVALGSTAAQAQSVLRLISQSDLTVLDPVFSTANITSNH